MSRYGFFMRIEPRPLPVAMPIYNSGCGPLDKRPFMPFYDGDDTVGLFLDALSRCSQEDARAYVSKHFASRFDFDELTDYFNGMKKYEKVIKAEFGNTPKNCKRSSILVFAQGEQSIMHLEMVREPDCFSNWKIYGIEKE